MGNDSALLELLAGKTRGSVVAALLQQPEVLKDAYQDAMDAEGSALKENEKYLDSIQGRIDLFNNAVQTMWSNALDDDFIKFIINVGTNLVKITDKIGLVRVALMGLWAYINTKFLKLKLTNFPFALQEFSKGQGFLGKIKGFFGGLSEEFRSTKDALEELERQYQEAENIFKVDPNEQNRIAKESAKKNLDSYKESFSGQQSEYESLVAKIDNLQSQRKQLMAGIDESLHVSSNDFKQSVKADVEQWFEVDTSKIDDEISDIENKLINAQEHLKSVKQTKWDDYKAFCASSPAKDKQLRIDVAQQEVGNLTNQLKNLQQQREALISDAVNQQTDDVINKVKEIDKQIEETSNQLDDLGNSGGKAFSKIGTGLKAFSKQLTSVLSSMAAMFVVSKLVEGLIWVVETLVKKIKGVSFEDLSVELSNTNSKLKDLESQLNTINDQIKEIESNTPIAYTDLEELNRLKALSAELEHQIELQKLLKTQQQKAVNNSAIKEAEKYKSKGKTTNKTTGETAWEGTKIGAGVGFAATSLGGAKLGTAIGTAIAPGVGSAVGAVIGIIVGTVVAGLTGAGIGAIVGAVDQNVGDRIDNMKEEYDKLQGEYKKAQDNYRNNASDPNYDKMQKAQEKLIQYESNMSEYLNEMSAYYNSIDLSVYDPIADADEIVRLRKEMDDFYDTQDKWAIQTGSQKAKSSAINRIFGENADKKIQKVGEELKRMAKEGENIDLKKAFDTSGLNQADLAKFLDRLHKMGLYIYEVEDAFKQADKAAEDLANTDIYDASKSVGSVGDGLESLKSAFDEVNEKGYITAKTISSIEEALGNTDKFADVWANYQNTMSSATASTEEMKQATEDLVKAFIDSKINFADGPISNDEMATYVRQLKDMGVTNAKEYIQDRMQEGMFAKIQLSAEFDEEAIKEKFNALKNNEDFQAKIGIKPGMEWDDLDEEIKNKIIEYTDDDKYKIPLSKIIDVENVKEIFDEYGYQYGTETLNYVITLLEQRNQKEREYQAILDQEEQMGTYDNQIAQIQEVLEEYDKLKEKYGDFYFDSWMDGESYFNYYMGSQDPYEFMASIDKEQFVEDYNTLREMFKDVGIELNIDDATIQKLQDKLDELNELKIQLEAEIDPESKNKIKSEIKQIESDIENLTSDIELNFDVTGLGRVGAIFDSYTSKMEVLASIQDEVANGFVISAQKAREFAAIYPEILQLATATSNGQIKLNADVVNDFLSGKRTELDATIDAQIAELEAQKAGFEARAQLLQWQLDLARQVANGELQISAQELMAKINNANAMVAALEAAGIDSKTANEAVYAKMSGDSKKYDEVVRDVAENSATNLDEAAFVAAESTCGNMETARQAVVQFMYQCQEAAKAMAGIPEGLVDGVDLGAFGGGGKHYSGNFQLSTAEFEPVEFDASLSDQENISNLIDNLITSIDDIQLQIDNIDGNISLLEALKNTPIAGFSPKGGGGGGGDDGKDNGDGKSALEMIKEHYEGILSNLENQRTYVQNEIEQLEAMDEGISKSYYEKQISLGEERIKVLEEERKALMALYAVEPSKENADALWEVEHDIQETTTQMIEDGKSIIDLYRTAAEELNGAYDNKDQLIEDSKSYLQGYMDLFDIQGELAHPQMYEDLIAKEQESKINHENQLASQQLLYDQFMGMENPYEAGTKNAEAWEKARTDAAIEMQAEMRQTALGIQKNDEALAQFNEDLKQLYFDGWNKVFEAVDRVGEYIGNQIGFMESYIDRLDAWNIDVPDSAYEDMIVVQTQTNADNKDALQWHYGELKRIEDEFAALGEDVTKNEEYLDKLNEIAKLEREHYEGETQIVKWQQEILENKFNRFKNLIDRINNSINTLQNLSGVLDREDVAYEDGTWTAEGITRAGLALHEIELQKQAIEECNKELKEQKRQLDAGKISQKTYNERTKEIKDMQWDAVNAIEAAKDSIIDLNEARIDIIEEGINKEIDAYSELIDLKREELDAERDLYDFRRNIQKQMKDIASLERRIASMSGSTDASTIAERTKLEKD